MKAPGLEWVPFMLLASRAGFAANPQPAAIRPCRRHRWAAGLLSFAGGVSRAMATGAGAWRSSKSGIRRAYILWLCTGSLDWNHFDRCFLRILQGWLFFWFVWGFIWSPWDWVALLPSFAATPALSLKWIWRQSSLYWLYQRGCFFRDTGYHLQIHIKDRQSLPLPSQSAGVALGTRCVSCMSSSIGLFVKITEFVKVWGFFPFQ